ncbi:hypothetical protein [Amycolatopsis sp. NPDC059657]|uniref:hypothetical protein n=1 Tax=Amycolatopsis sp. NPDC059657 TaxID=3346899 RepID=UPI00366F5FE6
MSTCSNSPLSALQAHFTNPRSLTRFDGALEAWSARDPELAGITGHAELAEVLRSDNYARHDVVLHNLLRRAATADDEGNLATDVVMNAMVPAVPGIVGRVIRATRAAAFTCGTRRGVTGAGVSTSESNRDIQAVVIGHLWEKVRCYPLRRRNCVAANLVRDTQRAVLRSFGVDYCQAAADVVSLDDAALASQVRDQPGELGASEELLELLSWALEQKCLDEKAAAILAERYFGEQIGSGGVVADRKVGKKLGMSQPTTTRQRQRAVEQLAAAAHDFCGGRRSWLG